MKAWVTAITNDGYLRGALALARSLNNSKSKFNLVVMATPNVSKQSLQELQRETNITLRHIEVYNLPEGLEESYS
jgi:copper homeostasis protein CutC